MITTQCEESFHEENQVVWLLSSLASRPYTDRWRGYFVGSGSGFCAQQHWQDLKLWKYCLGPFLSYPVQASRVLKPKISCFPKREVHRIHSF